MPPHRSKTTLTPTMTATEGHGGLWPFTCGPNYIMSSGPGLAVNIPFLRSVDSRLDNIR
jgi:hypothetical protein